MVVSETEVVVTVEDDGDGLPEHVHRSGTANLAARAEQHGGTYTLESRSEGGTRVRWAVPLPA